jgi:hypothetical protein
LFGVGHARLDEAINQWGTIKMNGQKLNKLLYPEDQTEDTLEKQSSRNN